MKRMYGLIMFAVVVAFFGALQLFSGCDNLTSEDTSTATDAITGDTATGDTATGQDTGSTENVTHKSGETISSSQKWSGTHILEGNLYIKAPVEITPCTKISIAANAKIVVSNSGSIKSIGTKDCPVVFTSAKDSKAKGDWNIIEIYSTASSDNAFDWTILEYGGNGDYGVLWIDDNVSIKIDNTTFDNSKSYGVYIEKDAKVDSFSGNKFTNIDLNPIHIEASEVGLLNVIETSNNTQNSVLVNGGTVSKAAVWKNIGIPYYLKSNIYIKAEVEIEKGNTMLVGNGVKIVVSDKGSIKSVGTKEKPITFTSSKSSKGKGDWERIDIYATSSSDNAFDWTVLEFGGDGDYGLMWIEESAKVTIDNTVFSNSKTYGLWLENGAEVGSFSGNTFTNIDLNPIYLTAEGVGQLDKIQTSNNAKNTVLIDGGTVEKAATWKNLGISYETKANISFHAPVMVEAGTTFLLAPNNKLSINNSGSLKLAGTQDANITIKSAKASPAKGDWEEIDIYATSNNDNVWSYVNIMYGGGGDYGQVWVEDGASLTLNNCKFSESKVCDIYMEDGANVVNSGSTYTVCQH